jgi:hypothetical protein
MDQNSSRRCPHFQIYSEPLDLEGVPAYLAIRHCVLTERMISLLSSRPEGAKLAVKLVINATNGKQFAFVGPDLEAVTQRSCTVRRCDERCTPAYAQHLDYFQIDDPHEDTVTCDEEDDADNGEKQDNHDPQPCLTKPNGLAATREIRVRCEL